MSVDYDNSFVSHSIGNIFEYSLHGYQNFKHNIRWSIEYFFLRRGHIHTVEIL